MSLAAPTAAGRTTMVGPATVCRMDSTLVRTVRHATELRPLIVGCVVTIVVGAGLYGAAMGWWRSPRQAVFASVKLIAMFGGLFALTTLTNVVAAGLVRARLSVAQVAVCTLVGLAVTAALMGAAAPLAWFTAEQAIPSDAALARSTQTAHRLLAGHVAVFAVAGTLGVVRVHQLLRALVDDPRVARRVLWAWLAVEGLVGAELSWVGRPFLGKPALPVTFLRADAFDSSFFEELVTMTHSAAGPLGPWAVGGLLLVAVVALAHRLSGQSTATFRIEAGGLALRHVGSDQTVWVPWDTIVWVHRHGAGVTIGREDTSAMRVDPIRLPCASEQAARAAYESIERARTPAPGPFRQPAGGLAG